MEWNPLHHPDIIDGYDISPYGDIRYNKSNLTYKATYHSSNGYDYALFINKDNDKQLFPIDEIIAMVYIPVPHELCGKRLTVKHINGDNRDISLSNLEWIEDIEIWKTCTYPGVKPDTYEVSNHGNVRNIITDKYKTRGLNHYGYFRTIIDGKEILVHRLVAWEFCQHDKGFNDKHVNHIDGIKTKNTFKNLEVITNQDNTKHATLTGLTLSCENHPQAKLSNDLVDLICQLIVKYKGDVPNIISDPLLIGKNITICDIHRIKEKDGWCSISDKYFDKNEYRTYPLYLNTDDVIKICKLNLKYPRQCKKIYREARKLGINISLSAVKHIIYKNTFRDISDQYF